MKKLIFATLLIAAALPARAAPEASLSGLLTLTGDSIIATAEFLAADVENTTLFLTDGLAATGDFLAGDVDAFFALANGEITPQEYLTGSITGTADFLVNDFNGTAMFIADSITGTGEFLAADFFTAAALTDTLPGLDTADLSALGI